MKKLYSLILIAAIMAVCVGCGGQAHTHSFGEWATKAPASCEIAEVEARTCECGEEETRAGDPATGHSFTSITAVSKMEKPMAGLTVEASDLSVTGACVCGENVAVTDGITIENAKLALGKNTVTVKYGDLSTTVNIEAEKLDIVLDGTVTDDAHISSGSKDKANASKKEMGTQVDEFRAYLRINVAEVIHTDHFAAYKENAKVQLVLPITGGSVADKTTFKLKTYTPAVGVTDADFSKLTWNNVAKDGVYGALNWSNGTVLVDTGVGHNVSVENDQITITLSYSQIADFVDENGNIVFAFATNTDGLKIGSLENKTETNRPAVKIVLNDEHFHVFDQEVRESKYFVSANCKEKAKYYLSCACGEAGTEIFTYGEIISHSYGEAIPEKLNTCTADGVKEHYRCGRCGKYFLYRDGQMKLVKAEDVKLSAGHDYKLINAKDPTCTEAGNYKYYKCGGCGKYFDADKKETTKEAQKIEKLPHSYGKLIEQVDATCTTDGVKAHYECGVCHKTFLEKDGEKVLVKAADLKISAGHDYKLIKAKDPTCTESGNYKYYKCGDCGLYFDANKNVTTKEAQKIEKLPHSYSDLVKQVDATCDEDGMKAHYRCNACGKYFVEKNGEKVLVKAADLKISAGHDIKVIAAKTPTCTKDGNNKYYQCRDCGKYFTDKAGTQETTKEEQKIPALGSHNYGDLIGQVDATCEEEGMKAHYHCSVCNTYFDENQNETTKEALKLHAHPNTKVIAAKTPTCTKDGNNKYYQCKDCYKYFVDKECTQETTKQEQKIPALGSHNYGDLIGQVDATCEEEGMKAHYHCSVCNTYFDENQNETTEEALKIHAHPNTKVIGAKTPTCTNAGNNKYYQCKDCGKYFADKECTQETTKEEQKIPARHTYEDGACTECGEPEPVEQP